MKKICRCRWDKKIAGVCGGFAQYFRCDPTIVRIFAIVLFFITGIIPLSIFYIIAWIVMPQGPAVYVEIPCKKLYRSKSNRRVAGICGGLGEYFNINPMIIRVFVILCFFFTAILPIGLSYLIGLAIIPENPDQ